MSRNFLKIIENNYQIQVCVVDSAPCFKNGLEGGLEIEKKNPETRKLRTFFLILVFVLLFFEDRALSSCGRMWPVTEAGRIAVCDSGTPWQNGN